MDLLWVDYKAVQETLVLLFRLLLGYLRGLEGGVDIPGVVFDGDTENYRVFLELPAVGSLLQ